MSTLTYDALHWGDGARETLQATIWDYAGEDARSVGVVDAISYRTHKGGDRATWRHAFERRPRLIVPAVLERAEKIASHREPPTEALAIGWLIDLELADGRRIVGPGVLVVTDSAGSSVWLALRPGLPAMALEQLRRGPIVTAHGIEK